MANKKVTNKALFDNPFDEEIKKAEAFSVTLDRIEMQFKSVLSASKDVQKVDAFSSYDDLKAVEKSISDVESANKNLLLVEKERVKLSQQIEKTKQAQIKLETEQNKANQAANKTRNETNKQLTEQEKLRKKLNEAQTEGAKETALLREEIRRQNKELKDNAAATLDSEDAYKTLVRETNKAQLEFKQVAAEFGVTSEEAENARAAFEKLDEALREINTAAKDGRRDVGRYELAYAELKKQVAEAEEELKNAATTYGKNSQEAKNARVELRKLNKQLEEIDKSAKDAKDGINSLDRGVKNLQKATKAFLIASGIGALIGIFTKIGELFTNNTEGADSFSKAINRVVVPLQVFANGLVSLVQNGGTIFNNFLIKGQMLLNDFALSTLNNFAFIGKAFDGYEEKVASLEAENEKLAASIEEVQNPFEGFGDEVEKRVETLDKVVDLTTQYGQRAAILTKEIADLRESQLQLQVQADDDTQSFERQLEALEALGVVTDEISAKELELLQNEADLAALRAKGNAQNVQLANEALIAQAAVVEAEAQQNAQREERERQRLVIERDRFEQELDLLFDISDRRKTVNEQIAADETVNFETRQKALDQTQKDIAETYQAIEDEFNNFIGSDAIDIQELISIEDTVELTKRLAAIREQFNVNEITTNRLREDIIELTAAENDLRVATDDLARSREDLNAATSELELLQEAYLKSLEDEADISKINEELSDARLQAEIVALRERLMIAEDGSIEAVNIETELTEKLLEQQSKRIENQKEADEKELELEKEKAAKRAEIQEAGFNIISELIDKENEKRLAAIDEEIDANQSRIEQLQEANENNTDEALNNLAFEEKRKAELERQREDEVKRQQQIELGLAAVEVFSSKVSGGTPSGQAIAETFTDINLLQQLIAAIPSFDTGIDLTGKGDVDNKGGFLSILHPNEMVMSEKDRSKMIGNPMSRTQVIDTFNLGAAMSLNRKAIVPEDKSILNMQSLEIQINKVEKAIKNQPVNTGVDYDVVNQMIITAIKKGNKIERKIKKPNGIF